MRKFCTKCSHIEEEFNQNSCKQCQGDLQIEPSHLRDELKGLVQSAKDHAKKIIDAKLKDYQPFLELLSNNKALPLFHLNLASASLLTSVLKINDQLNYEDQLILVKSLCTTYTEITGLDALTENLNYFQNHHKDLKNSDEVLPFIGAWPVLASLNLKKDLNGFYGLCKMGEATQLMIKDFGIFISEFSEQLNFLIDKSSIN
ncbi:MAG: hypothetical protein KC646_13530 [Candidatus Cloacimonetes bacterium]|nr:hypothetical protein [Candidatus Cloacimonadota bacterium]